MSTIPRVVISMTLTTEGEQSETLAFLSAVRSAGATDVYDQIENVKRLADQMVSELFRRAALGKPDNLIVLDIVSADRRLIIADWLREKAKELKGFTLYHPEYDLRAWASQLAPTAEEFAAAHPPKPLGLRSATVVKEPTQSQWPSQTTPEHCRAVEAFRGFAAGEPRSFYGVSRLRETLSSHVVLDYRPTGGRFVVAPNGDGKPPAEVAFAGSQAECDTFAGIANAELIDKAQKSEPK